MAAAKRAKALTAADICREVAARRAATEMPPSKGAMVELRKAMDAALADDSYSHRITAADAMRLLRSHGWRGGRARFERLLKREFGHSWPRPRSTEV